MALPTSVTATGAGNSSCNGVYTQAGTDSHGNIYFASSSGYYLVFSSSVWALFSSVGGGDPSYYDSASGQTPDVFPLTGWAVAYGTPSAPSFSVGSSGPTTYPAVMVVNSLCAETAGRGATTLAARQSVESILGEAAPSAAHSYPGASVTESPTFSENISRGAAFFTLRSPSLTVFLSQAVRVNRVGAAGSTVPPVGSWEPPTFAETAGRGALSFVSRVPALTLFSLLAGHLGFGFARRGAGQPALFTASASAGRGVSAAVPATAIDNRDPFFVLETALRFLAALGKGNPMATAQTTLAILDKIAASYRINELTQLANTLAGLPTLIRGGDGVTSTIYGYGDDTPILALLPAAEALNGRAVPSIVIGSIYNNFFSALASYMGKLGYPSLNAYATAQNALSRNSFLVHPNAALLNYLYSNQAGSLLLSPGNVFAPQTTFGTAVVGPSAGVIATYTDLASIPTASVISPSPGASTQGYTPAPGLVAVVSAAVNGTLTVTVTGNGQSASGAATAGRTWTGTLSSAAAGATITFTPTVAGDRISHITNVTGSGAATAGAFSLVSVIERAVS